MGCTLSSSARPQMKSQRHTAFGHHSDSEFVDVVKLAPGSLEFWPDRCSTGPPVQLRQTDEYPACSEIHGVMHADASRRDSVMWCFTPSGTAANLRATSPWFTLPSLSNMLSNFEWRLLSDVGECGALPRFLYLECRSIYLNQQKKGVDVCHDFELRGVQTCFSFTLVSIDATSYHCHFPGTSFLRSSPKSQLYSRRKLYEYRPWCHIHPKVGRNVHCLAHLTLHESSTFRCTCGDCNCPVKQVASTALKQVKTITAHHFLDKHDKESTFFSNSSTHVWGTRNYLSVHGKSEIFRTQSALQDRDQNLTCSEVDAELGAKNIVVELNFHDVKVGNSSIACSPIPRKYRFDECILQDGDVNGKYSPSQTMLFSANKPLLRSFGSKFLRKRSPFVKHSCLSKPGNPHLFCDVMHGRCCVPVLPPPFDTPHCGVHYLSDHPALLVLDSFLTPEECDALIAVAAPELRRSRVTDGKLSNGRTSSSVFLTAHMNNPVVVALESRVISAVHIVGSIIDAHRRSKGIQSISSQHLVSAEPFQVVHYSEGQSYTSHYDNKMGCVRRACTFMAYLSDVESGGATHFPKAVVTSTQGQGIKVWPKKGRALVFWSAIDGWEDPNSLHEAETVARGSKWIVTKWLQVNHG